MKRKSLRPKPRRILRLPDLDHSKSAVLNTLKSAESQRAYRYAIDDFIAWYCSEPRLAFNKTVVLRYRLQIPSSVIVYHLPLMSGWPLSEDLLTRPPIVDYSAQN